MKIIHELTTDKRLKIVQRTDRNSYTFDSVLLADFTNVKKKTYQIVDLCSGNAPIAMLLSTKKENLEIKCIEIQEEMCDLANESLVLNQLEDKIEVICADVKNISKKIGQNKYDVVVCNPPYFKLNNNGNINVNDAVAIARHEISITLEDIILESQKLLDNNGVLTMVHRPERIDEIIILLNKYNFTIKRLRLVYPKEGEEANTLLIEASKRKTINNKIRIEPPLYVYTKDNEYTKEAFEIMDF